MAKLRCEICARYSDFFSTEKDLTDHMTEVHPDDPRTLARIRPERTAAYGVTSVGKTKAPDVENQENR